MDRIFVAAEPTEGTDPEALAETLAEAAPDTDLNESVRNGFAITHAWLPRNPPFDTLTRIETIQRACYLDFSDTAGGGGVYYFDRLQGDLRLIETVGYDGAGTGLDYIDREYDFRIDDPWGW